MRRGDDGQNECIDLGAARLARTDAMIHTEITQLYEYWERLRGGGPVPYRTDVDPRDMSCSARHLFIIEAHAEGAFRFRLAGTGLIDAFGMELRGMAPRAIMAEGARESLTAMLEETLAEPGIGYARLITDDRSGGGSEAASGPVSRAVWELLLLPLRTDTGRVERILGALHPVSGDAAPAEKQGESALRFTFDTMSIRPIEMPEDHHVPEHGFAEAPPPFSGVRRQSGVALRTIKGGRQDEDPAEGDTPRAQPELRIVRDEQDG